MRPSHAREASASRINRRNMTPRNSTEITYRCVSPLAGSSVSQVYTQVCYCVTAGVCVCLFTHAFVHEYTYICIVRYSAHACIPNYLLPIAKQKSFYEEQTVMTV